MPAAGARYPSIWCTIATTNWRADRAIRLAVPLQFAAPSPRVSPGGFAGLSSLRRCCMPYSAAVEPAGGWPCEAAVELGGGAVRAEYDDKGEVMDLSGHRQHRSDQP
jgi:hypothetical protein